MELLKVSDDHDEVVKERKAAAAERAAASEERRAAAAERQALCAVLDRACSLLTKSSATGSCSPDHAGIPVQQNGQDSTLLIAPAPDNEIHCQDGVSGVSIPKEGVEDSFTNIDENASKSNGFDRRAAELLVFTHSQSPEVKNWSAAEINHGIQDCTDAGEDTSISHSFVENQETMQSASTCKPMCAEQASVYLHPEKQSTCDSIPPAGADNTVNLQFNGLDMLSPTSAQRLVQASSVCEIRFSAIENS